MAKAKGKSANLSGLDSFKASSLLGGEASSDASGVQYADIERFHGDDENARKSFDIGKLQELADTMEQVNPATGKPRGILEPLNVKPHPDIEGDFIVNGGNRRLRAAQMAGLDRLPYFVANELDDFDKFILNDQRENLSPLEIASFIKEKLDQKVDGKKVYKSSDVAKMMGRHSSYVSDHSIFFDMSDHVRALYDQHLCKSMQGLALLHRAYKSEPEKVSQYCENILSSQQEVTTSQVRDFVNSIKKPTPKKVYKNPHTNEVIEIKTKSDKQFKAWVAEYGRDIVESWLQDPAEQEGGQGTEQESEQGTEQEGGQGTEQEGGQGTEQEGGQGAEQEGGQGAEQESEQGTEQEGGQGTEQESEQGTEQESEQGTEQESEQGTEQESEQGSDREPSGGGRKAEEQPDLELGTGSEAQDVEKAKQFSSLNTNKSNEPNVLVKYDGKEAKLLTDKRPTYGFAWIIFNSDNSELEVSASDVTIIAVL